MAAGHGSRWCSTIAPTLAVVGLGGCGHFNEVEGIAEGDWFSPAKARAVVVVGVGYDVAEVPPTDFRVHLTQFVEQGQPKILSTGEAVKSTVDTTWCNLFSSTRSVIEVTAAREVAVTHYVFSVPAGQYAYTFSGVLRPPFGIEADKDVRLAFNAPAGAVTYFGDFVYRGKTEYALWRSQSGDYTMSKEKIRHVIATADVEFRRDLTAARKSVKKYRTIKGDPELADTEMVSAPRSTAFCTL
jgi:hypothetical protein